MRFRSSLAALLLLAGCSQTVHTPTAPQEPCLVLGDSLAVGLGALLPCITVAQVGISAEAVLARTPDHYTGTVFVSAGSNNGYDSTSLRNTLRSIRAKLDGTVVWVVPIWHDTERAVLAVAHEYGDDLITFTRSNDGVHPASYAELAVQAEDHL